MANCAPSMGAPTRAPFELATPSYEGRRHLWTVATEAERRVRTVMDVFDAQYMTPANDAYKAGAATIEEVSEWERRWSPYTSAHAKAVNAVMMTPAPDLSAVASKVEMAIAEDLFDGGDEADEMLHVMLSDLKRLGDA